ncbi:Flp pilus assembly protein CpaB [Parerythrobacter aurantius]|uniref:Flp pilus assembly protein CpaB n=1 Tax=Parerythrobacter aurantius TaxID=3127706 RepID=UPI0032521489
MDRRNIIILAVAILVGAVAVYLANSWFSGVEQRQAQVAEKQRLVRVVVANQDLTFGAPISSDTVRLANWPADSVPEGAITDLQRLTTGTNVAIRPIARGEPILISRISDRAILSANIPQNMRAITVPIGATTGVGGFVFPGDVVDVFLTRPIPGDGAESNDKMTTVLLENIQVLAVDQKASETETNPEVGKTATVLVDQRSAQKLALAEQVGTLTMALRNVEDQLIGPEPVITTRDLGGRGIYMADRSRGSAPAPSVPTTIIRAAPDGTPRELAKAPMRPSGPSMTVVRGTESTTEEVRRHGSSF